MAHQDQDAEGPEAQRIIDQEGLGKVQMTQEAGGPGGQDEKTKEAQVWYLTTSHPKG